MAAVDESINIAITDRAILDRHHLRPGNIAFSRILLPAREKPVPKQLATSRSNSRTLNRRKPRLSAECESITLD
jgi:hypothetical protein